MLKSTRLAHQTQDDGFHEIQLNGKQLVFLFMAATVVSVVIFLCGVLVGRGVRGERGGSASDAAAAGAPAPADVLAEPAPATPPAAAAGSDPTAAAAPPPADEGLTYYDRLEKKTPPKEDLKKDDARKDDAGKKDAKPAPAAEPPARTAPAAAGAAPASAAASGEPAGQGYAVQIAALNVRSEADAIAKRLVSKGYAAYVLAPPSGTPTVFRVRVGKFKTRREAETIAAKLKKEEQFAPWITR